MNQFFSYFHNLINTTLLLYKISNSLTSKTDIQKKKNHIQLFIQVVFFCLILLSSKKKKKNNQLILSPSGLGSNIKPGLFSKHCELNKFNKQNSFKVEETLTPKLFETKESSFAPQPKLQKSQSASRLALPKESKQYRVERQELDNIPNIKHNQMNELSSKLYRELIEFNEQADFGGQNEIQQWSDDMIKKLMYYSYDHQEFNVQENLDNNKPENQQNDIIQNLQKELNDEWKERQKIEEEATNLITEQELEIDKLEKQLKMLEEQHSQ